LKLNNWTVQLRLFQAGKLSQKRSNGRQTVTRHLFFLKFCKKQGRETMEPRDYQAECLEKALKGNTIMCGDT
jgi:hypothetical protein